jgi:hypothetical protein
MHESMQLMLARHPLQRKYGIQLAVERKLNQYQNDFVNIENLGLHVVTWNCAGNEPYANLNLSEVLLPPNSTKTTLPDLVVIGLQEIVPLSAKQIFAGKNKARNALWERLIFEALQYVADYDCIARQAMVGLLIFVFVKNTLKGRIRDIKTSKVKTGLGGSGGNKGAVAVRLTIDDSSFAFINVHLASD